MERIDDRSWFSFLSNENVDSIKISQLFIVLTPTLQKWFRLFLFDSSWFSFFSDGNVDSMKMSELFIVLTPPTLQKWDVLQMTLHCEKIDLRGVIKKLIFAWILSHTNGMSIVIKRILYEWSKLRFCVT